MQQEGAVLSLGYRQGEAGAPSLEDARSAGHWVARRGAREGRRTCSLGRAGGQSVSRGGQVDGGQRQAMEDAVGDAGGGGGRQCSMQTGSSGFWQKQARQVNGAVKLFRDSSRAKAKDGSRDQVPSPPVSNPARALSTTAARARIADRAPSAARGHWGAFAPHSPSTKTAREGHAAAVARQRPSALV